MTSGSAARPLVMHLIDELPVGGAERLIVDLLRYPSAHFRYVVGCVIRSGPLEAELREMGIPVVVFGRRGRLDIGLIFRLAGWMRRERVMVVHTHLFTADTYGRIAARLAGVPAVFSTVHSIANPWKGPIHRALDWLLGRVSTRVIGCSDEVAAALTNRDGLPARRVVAIRNGIDLRRIQGISGAGVREEFGISPSRLLLAIIGRHHEPKGHIDFLNALARLDPAERARIACLFVGDGELRPSLESEVHRLGLSECVIFTGVRRDVPRLLGALDIFVLSSRWEGLPLSLLEAMAGGVACLATAVGGVPGVIDNGVNGILVGARDAEAMASALRKLVEDAGLRTRLGQCAREHVLRHYDIGNTARAYEALYRDALGMESAEAIAHVADAIGIESSRPTERHQ